MFYIHSNVCLENYTTPIAAAPRHFLIGMSPSNIRQREAYRRSSRRRAKPRRLNLNVPSSGTSEEGLKISKSFLNIYIEWRYPLVI